MHNLVQALHELVQCCTNLCKPLHDFVQLICTNLCNSRNCATNARTCANPESPCLCQYAQPYARNCTNLCKPFSALCTTLCIHFFGFCTNLCNAQTCASRLHETVQALHELVQTRRTAPLSVLQRTIKGNCTNLCRERGNFMHKPVHRSLGAPLHNFVHKIC